MIRKLRVLVSMVVLLSGLSAKAAPVPLGLQIVGNVSLDTLNSLPSVGSATQTGTLSLVSGGVLSSSSFTGLPTSISPAALSGGLIQTGDRIGARFSMSAISTGGTSQTDGLFADYSLSLSNSSATSSFTLVFAALIQNSVTASGDDAFAFSDISVRDALNNEIYFSDLRVDTVNPGGNLDASSPGNTFSVVLAPGENMTLTALQRQRGGVFAAGSYAAELDAFLSLQSVSSDGTENQVPLPGTLPLLAGGLLALALSRRRRFS